MAKVNATDLLNKSKNNVEVEKPTTGKVNALDLLNKTPSTEYIQQGVSSEGIPIVKIKEESDNTYVFTKDVNKSQTVPFFGFNFVVPKTKNPEVQDDDTPFKGLLEFNTKKALSSIYAPMPLEQTRNEIQTLKTSSPDQISDFQKEKIADIENYYNSEVNKIVTLDTPEQAEIFGKLQEQKSKDLRQLNNSTKQASFYNSAFMYKNIDDWMATPNEQIIKTATQIGNDIENISSEEKRSQFKALADSEVNELSYPKMYKEKLAYLGLESEKSNIIASINDDIRLMDEKSEEVKSYIEELKLNPGDKELIEKIKYIINNDITPIELTIRGKNNFLEKLKSVQSSLPEIDKQIKRQEKIEEDYKKYVDIGKDISFTEFSVDQLEKQAKYINAAGSYFVKGLANRLSSTIDAAGIYSYELAEKLGSRSKEEKIIGQTNLATSEERQFTLPKKIKEGAVLEKDEKGNIVGVDWNVALPMALQTTAETLTMGYIGAPLARLGKIGQLGGLYAGSTVVFGGDILKEELNKGLSLSEASFVTSLRLGAEAATEMINLLEFLPFNGILKKGTVGKVLSKSDFINYVGKNWKTIFPRMKALNLDVAKILLYTGKNVGFESLEEVMSDLGNYGIDQFVIDNIKPDYRADSEFSLENEIETALTTALTMLPMGGYGGVVQNKLEKQSEYLRWTASQEPKNFLENLEKSFKDGLITEDFYRTGKKEIETIKTLYDANKVKIENTEEDLRPTYLNLLYTQKEISENISIETNEKRLEALYKELETTTKKLQYFDSEALENINLTPVKKYEKTEERHLENLNEFLSEEELQSATKEDLISAKSILDEVVNDPFSPTVKEKALEKIELINNELTKKEESQKQEKTYLEELKEKINTMSLEELENYNPFRDKNLSKESGERAEINNLKLEKQQELKDKEDTVVFGDKTFKKGQQVSIDGNNSYWYIDSITPDKGLKLSRKFENSTETTTISDPNDVSLYTPKAEEFTTTPLETLENTFGKQEETPTEVVVEENDIEAKKADIEKRRQEELTELEIKYVSEDYRIGRQQQTFDGGKSLGEAIDRNKKETEEINAKYDAELDALEQPKEEKEIISEPVVEQEVSNVKPQEPEKAKKQQDKEVLEKFEAPATPFKNGKVKTSNWNTVLSTITRENVLNYRVKVVNTNSLKFKDLPYQTQQYFTEQAIINKTSVEDVMSKDKGKMLVLTDKEGNYILEEGLPVITNFSDGKLAEYKKQYERQGLSEKQYFDKIEEIKKARENNSTLLIDRISNYPVEITQDTNELSVAIGENDFSITKGSKGFPVVKLGNQEINIISRKLTENEIESINYILFKRWATSGSMSDKKSDKYQKAQYVQKLILTGVGVGKINFKGDPKARTWEITLKQPDGNWKIANEQEVRDFLKNQWVNIDIKLSEENIPFTTYKIEEGKTVVDEVFPTYKDFIKSTFKTKGVSATKLQDNFYIEVGDVDNTLSAKITEATEEKAPKPTIVETPKQNTSIEQDTPTDLDFLKQIDSKQKKSIDTPTSKDDFSGLLRNKKLSQEVTEEQDKKAKEWFDNSPLKNYISLNQLQNIVNSDAYASWNWGAINLFKSSQHTDLYHEAWHEFSQLYLTKKQKEALYNEVRNLPQYKKYSNKQIEEVIAEDFRNYALSNGKLILNNRFKRNSIFRNIWNFLKEWVTGNTDIQTVYERLYTGNISKYKRDLNNAFWGNLNLGIPLKDGKQFSDTDTKNLYRAIDSLVGTIFEQNSKPVTMMFADNKVLSVVYGAIYKRFVTEYNDLLDVINNKKEQKLSVNDIEKLKVDVQILNNLEDVINNWNEIIANHKRYSAFFNISKDKITFDEEGNITSIDDLFTEETDEGNSRESELIKNENVSSKEAASNETIFTIATLPRYNADGTKATNPFLPFVSDVVDFNSTWDKLTTATNNHLEYTQILSQIEELSKSNKSFKDLLERLPNPNKSLTDDEQRMKGAFMNDISKPLVQVYELIMTPIDGKITYSYKTAASSDIDKIKRQWNDVFESMSPFIKQHPDDSLYTDREEIKSIYSATGTKPAFYYNQSDYNKADKEQMFENRIDFLFNMGIRFSEETLQNPEFKELITKDFTKNNNFTYHSSAFSIYELITKSTGDISSLNQLSKVKPATQFKFYAKAIQELAEFELLGSDDLFAQSVKNAEQNNVWQIRQWNYITKVFNALNDVEKYPTYEDLQKEDWLQQFNEDVNPYVKGIYLNTLFDLNPESPTYKQRRVLKKGNKTIYPTISLQDYNGLRLNLSDSATNEGKGTTSLTGFEKIVQNINSLLLFNTQENLRYGDKSSSFSTNMSHYLNNVTGKLEERKSIIPFNSFVNKREAIVLPKEAFKYLVSDLRQEIIPMIRFENDSIGSNLKHYNKNIKNFGTFDGILSEETKKAIQEQIISKNIQNTKEIDGILLSLPLQEEFENYIKTKSTQLSNLLDTEGILSDKDIFDPRIIEENIKTPEGKSVPQELSRQSMLYGYVVNSLLYNIEHTKIISFDPRFYKTPKDVIKRLSAWSATGNMFVVDEQTNNFIDNKGNAIKDAVAKKLGIEIPKIFSDGKIKSVIFQDNEYEANTLFQSYKDKFLATGKYSSEQLNTILKAYNSVNEADGQGYVTFDLLRESKLRAGSSHWTKEHEIAYQKEAKFLSGESLTGMSSEEKILFTPQKWQEAGIGLTNENIPYPSFYKFSVVPLIPSAIKGTNFEKIHDNLVKQNVGLALFESGSKASGVLNTDGKYNSFYSNYETRTPYEGEYTINTVFFQYLKEQVNVDPSLKEEVSFSTQMRKLLHLNLYNNGVPNDVKLSPEEWNKLSEEQQLKQSDIFRSEQRFGDVIENLIKIEQKSLLKKMGATKQEDENYKLDAEKLSQFFKEEFIKRDLPNEVVNYLQAFEGEFLFPIDAFKQRATIERIAYSVANKKLVQQKITGEALVQVASTGFEITDKFSSVREDSDLPFYTEPGKAQKIKIAFTKRWKPLLNLEYKDEKIKTLNRLNEAIKDEKWLEQNKKAITIVGVRIPVQGLNSQEFMEVYHFLPESMGAIIVVSPALVAKSGGDFDIDKLTTFFPNLNKKGEVVKKLSEEELKNSYNTIVNKFKKEDKAVDKLISSIFGVTEEELQEELIQELLENKEIIPFEQFKNIQDKKAYENELIDLIKETLSRPDNFLQLVRPNDTDLLKNNEYGADKIKELFPKQYQDDTFTSVVDFASILEEFKSNLVGKANLGIAAVANVFFALSQRAGLYHNLKYTYKNFSGKSITKSVDYYLPHNTISINGVEHVSLSGLNSKNSNNYISDIISQYINGFVDVAKDDWVFFIGGVKELVPTMLYTALAGTNAKTTIAFFNQPIMREYIKNIDKYKNLFTRFKNPEAYQNGNWKALEDAVYTYVKKDEKLHDVYESAFLDKTPLPFIKIRKYVNENVSPSFLTEERLSDALYNNNPLTAEEEIFLLFHFWELKRQSGIITNLQRSLNADTKKVGNGYSSIERQTMFDDVLNSNLFNSDAMYRMRNESTIKAFTNDKTGFDKFSQQLFTDLFEITNHPTFNKVIRDLIKNDKELNFEFKFSKLEKLVNTIKNDFITYLYQNQVLDGNDNLFKKTQPLFNPKSSIALELKNIKQKYPNLSQEFPILDLIIPDNLKSDNRIIKTNLKLKARLADKDELDNAVFQIRQLLTLSSIKYTPQEQIEIQQFTDRLVKFIIVQSGLNPSVYNLLDIVPNEAYTQNIKSIIKDVQNQLNKDKDLPIEGKNKSETAKNINKFYNRFKVENPSFYTFVPTEDEVSLNYKNQRGKNYYLPTTDITGAKAKVVEDKLLAYIPTLPSKSIIVDKNNGQTLKQNPKSLFIVYDNEKEDNKKALSLMKIVNFAIITSTSIEVMERQIDEIILKSMNYDTILFNTTKGYFQDIKESNPELFNYGSQRLKDLFNINNLGFEEIQEQEVIEQPINKEIKPNELQKQNLFTVKPIQAADKKAIVKASVANKYIGFGEGIANSSTELYRKQAGEFANVGNYSSNDVIFVSIGGKRGDVTIRKGQQDKTIKEALKAIEVGATLITDNKSYVESSDYNEGEKRLAKNLESKGYVYSEQTIDGQVLGVWNKTQEQPIVEENKKIDLSQYSDPETNGETQNKDC